MKKVRHRHSVGVWAPRGFRWLFGYPQSTVAWIPIIGISIYDHWNLLGLKRLHISEYTAAERITAARSSVRAGRIEDKPRGCGTRAVLVCYRGRPNTRTRNRNRLGGTVVRWTRFPHAPLGKRLGEFG
jgi:hypothetical protein